MNVCIAMDGTLLILNQNQLSLKIFNFHLKINGKNFYKNNGSQLKEVAGLTDKTMNEGQNLIQAQTLIRGTKPAISFKVLLSVSFFIHYFFSLCSQKSFNHKLKTKYNDKSN